ISNCKLSITRELNVPVLLEELEIADEIERLRTHFQLGEPNHLSQVALPVAPVQRRHGHAPKGRGRKALALLARQVVERDGAHAFSSHYDLLGLVIARRRERLDRIDP